MTKNRSLKFLLLFAVMTACCSIQCGKDPGGKRRSPRAGMEKPDANKTLDPNGDEDKDGKKNSVDNCPLVANPLQEDLDNDNVGDVCDICPQTPNARDATGKQGNVCDPNAEGFQNPALEVLDPDGDEDKDGIKNGDDNCPRAKNPQQEDQDGDKVGDVCDLCPRIANSRDPATGLQPNYCIPTLPDYKPNFVTQDTDSDGVPDIKDNCRNAANPQQEDKDVDGVGDACDNCPDIPNPKQENTSTVEPTKGDACKESIIPGQQCVDNTECKSSAREICTTEKVCACGETAQVPVRIPPSFLLVLDASASMGGSGDSGAVQAKAALDELVDATADSVHYGVLFFGDKSRPLNTLPPGSKEWGNEGDGHRITLVRPVGTGLLDDSAVEQRKSDLKALWADYPTSGGTPTGAGLEIVRSANLFADVKGPKVVVIVTDGYPDDPELALETAEALYAEGISVYVVGVTISGGTNSKQIQGLKKLAAKGSGGEFDTDGDVVDGTGRPFYNANDLYELKSTLKKIAGENYSCDLTLSNTDGSNKIYTFLDGKMLKRGGQKPEFVYDATKEKVTLVGQKCEEAKKASNLDFKVIVGCPEVCKPTINPRTGQPFEEGKGEAVGGLQFCLDGIDNDCDGRVDDGCEACVPEVCGDDKDNDCDGVVDNGCIGTKKLGDKCEHDYECEQGRCSDTGVCIDKCRDIGSPCAVTPDNPQPCCGSICGFGGVCTIG